MTSARQNVLPVPLWIARKRDGHELEPAQIEALIKGAVSGAVPEYQLSALLMAVYFQGLSPEELTALTRAMLNSGDRISLADIDGPTVDKHSTGGVGDKVTLCLAPLVAACGVGVPMLAGRGLGHTGGTLDKLAAIEGLQTELTPTAYRRVLRKAGCVVAGQSDKLVPADRIFYALRDATGTVPSLPLIASSIMSKKKAGGAGALLLDVKVGSGAFLPEKNLPEGLLGPWLVWGGSWTCPPRRSSVTWISRWDGLWEMPTRYLKPFRFSKAMVPKIQLMSPCGWALKCCGSVAWCRTSGRVQKGCGKAIADGSGSHTSVKWCRPNRETLRLLTTPKVAQCPQDPCFDQFQTRGGLPARCPKGWRVCDPVGGWSLAKGRSCRFGGWF